MPDPNDRLKTKIRDAFEQASEQAAYKMTVRHSLGGEMTFENFAEDVVTGAAMDLIIDEAVRRLRGKGIKLRLGDGGPSRWDDFKPDRYTIMYDGKTVRAGVRWTF